MTRFQKLAPWLTRLMLLPPSFIFTLVGVRGLAHLTTDVGARGIVFTSGYGITTGHIGFGAFPLACALFVIGCLFSERLLPVALGFVAILDGVVLLVRLISMYATGANSNAENMRIVYAEIVLLVLVAAGALIELSRRRASTSQLPTSQSISLYSKLSS